MTVLSPSGNKLALLEGSNVHIWSVEERRKLETIAHPGYKPVSGAWHRDEGVFAVGESNGPLLVRDLEARRSRFLSGHSQWVILLAADPQGEVLVSGSFDSSVRFWDAVTGDPLFVTRRGTTAHFNQDGTRLGLEHKDKGFEISKFIRSDSFQVVTSPTVSRTYGLDISPDSRWIIFGDAGSQGWRVWSVAARKEVSTVSWPELTSPVFDPSGSSVIGMTPTSIVRWRFEATDSSPPRLGPPERLFVHPTARFERAAFSGDGQVLAVAGRHKNFLVDLSAPTNVVEFSKGRGQFYVALSPDHRFVATAKPAEGPVEVWDARTGLLLRQLATNVLAKVAISPDGRTLVTTTGSEVYFWNTANWQLRRRLPLDLSASTGMPAAFSPDGKVLAIGSDRQMIKLIEAETCQELATLTPPEASLIDSIIFSADGRYLAAAGLRNRIYLWDLRTLRHELAAMRLDW